MTLITALLILTLAAWFMAALVAFYDRLHKEDYENWISVYRETQEKQDDREARLALRTQRTVSRMPRER